MSMVGKVWHAVLFAPVLGCTPLGVWIYEDPAVTVSRVRLGSDSLSDAPVLVALDLQNPNDYPVSTISVQLTLQLDDLPVGELNHDSTVVLPQDGSSTVSFPLVLQEGMPAGRLIALGAGTHRFTVRGRAEFTTPLGKRLVRFAQAGDLRFGPSPSPASVPAGPNG